MSIDAFSQAFAGTDWDKLAAAARPAPAAAPAVTVGAKAQTGLAGGDAAKPKVKAKEEDGFLTFNDVLDIVNPLQHIPIVDAIYRRVTGDTIRPQGTILGGFLYGGLIGGALSTAGVLFTETTGIDPVPDAIAYLVGDDAPAPPQVAAAAPALTPPAPAAIAQAPAAGRPIPPASSAATTARRNLVAANQSALQLLAQDLAAGGQVGSADAAGAGPTAPGPAAQPTQAVGAGAGAGQSGSGRMPARGMVATNAAMPRGLYAARPYAAYTRATPVAAMDPARVPGAPPALPTPGAAPVGAAPAIKPLSLLPPIKPLNPADGAPVRPLDAPAPITGAAAVPGQPPGPEALGGDGIQQLMMLNLDKYQAMSRAPGRIGARAAAGNG